MKTIVGHVLGLILLVLSQSGKLSPKWRWLSHFLLGSGKALTLPNKLAQDWNVNLVRPLGDNRYFIRPYPSELFWIVGSMIVQITDSMIVGEDTYSFQPQTGQQVIHGKDKSLQYAWSGGDGDPTQITGRLASIGLLGARLLGIGENIVKIENGRLLVSNELWNVLGGKAFQTVLTYRRSEERVIR